MSRRHPAALAVGTVATVAAAAGGYVLERAGARRLQADQQALVAAGRTMPAGVRHHFVPVSDGGTIHVVELGTGTPVVLVHGLSLSAAVWAVLLRQLAPRHRVLAVDQRGHGRSLAGDGGYSFERMADDLLEVLEVLDIGDGLLVGHSMGGMVAQVLAARGSHVLGSHVGRLVLVATTAGPIGLGPLAAAGAVVAEQGIHWAERRGGGVFPNDDLSVWTARAAFGRRPAPVDVELTRSLIGAMSPAVLATLVPQLLVLDVRDQLASVDLPTSVVVGSRDVLTPPRAARAIAGRVKGADLTVLPGCGHMIMLERAGELCELLG